MTSWLDEVKFNEDGLVPVIAQEIATGEVMMLAWASKEALAETAITGRGVYFSRSRGKLWRKGEESGNYQIVSEIRLDCDGDAVIYRIHQVGDVACHTGHASCFYRALVMRSEGPVWEECAPVLKDPAEMYGAQGTH